MRVLIVGATGVGKTTAARRIKGKLNLPLIELDDFFGGKRLSQEEADSIIERVTVEYVEWIIEGAFLFPKLFELATHIILVEVPFPVALYRSWKRYFWRLIKGTNLYGSKSLFLTTKHIFKMYFSREPLNNYKSFRVWAARELGAKYPEKIKLGNEFLQ